MTEREVGTVKWFSNTKGYGFIIDDKGEDYFFHISNLKNSMIVEKNDTVTFEIEKTQKGLQAINVEIVA